MYVLIQHNNNKLLMPLVVTMLRKDTIIIVERFFFESLLLFQNYNFNHLNLKVHWLIPAIQKRRCTRTFTIYYLYINVIHNNKTHLSLIKYVQLFFSKTCCTYTFLVFLVKLNNIFNLELFTRSQLQNQ